MTEPKPQRTTQPMTAAGAAAFLGGLAIICATVVTVVWLVTR